MKLMPEGEKVLVRVDNAETITAGGLIIPDVAREQQQTAATRGEIVAIGPTAQVFFSDDTHGVSKCEANPGDRVIFSKFGGSRVMIGRVEHRLLYDKDIICKIEGDEEKEMPDSRKPMVN